MPYNLEAEQSAIGAALVDSAIFPHLLELLKPEYFYRPQHKSIFSIMSNMFISGQTIDFVTVLDKVKSEGIFENDNDAKSYFVNLVQIVPSVSNVEAYADIIRDKYRIRMLMEAAKQIEEEATEGSVEAQSLLDSAEQKIYEIRQGGRAHGLTKIDEAVLETYDKLQKLSGSDKSKYLGTPTGFKDIDDALTGLNRSDLIIIAGRPGHGKTTFALNIASNVALKQKKKVVIFSIEMSIEQLVSKILSSEAGIDSKAFRTGDMTTDEWYRLTEAAQVLSKTELYFDDSAGITVAEIKAKLRRVEDVGLLVIDYLQLMSAGKAMNNRVLEISEITRGLKILAREFDIPVILISQLSRSSDKEKREPRLSDLRDSGSIEQDADIVLILDRDKDKDEDEQKNVANCIIAKNRHGETGTKQLSWDGTHSRFRNLDPYR
ncbi:MAG: replicative DNA helicase [Oscillospiraceae bacterium]|nr:replicative DNA helicase [Oscillospiraceae bacterium]